ncbi:proteinase inhibitor I2 Kunitz metazoa [Rhodomicrobium vannielii ATCC 17100]|uniref:Proteinase inhibitor I2 Kunitz metazoa n=1 Tax=Rhodomicrobium vannielii (strain ATCC 17100 / DSM 162 / LMG 4299 / NCIMB 10020 / ATH 3.1.1) TaxID=648757 RepID=E3I842_RHOVT|nr:proteinase inhibitor I2 Kunitz metazoa [Rhodomicrobium vannielii ATCC 17100]
MLRLCKSLRLLGAILPAVFLIPLPALADMGRVMVSNQGVTVEESAQKAIILANGREEVLILGTEIGASGKTSILRFIPFPAEPKAELAAPGAFQQLASLAKKYDLRFQSRWQTKGGSSSKDEGVKVVSSARLGAHDLTTVRIRDVAAFRSWVNDYFKSHDLPLADAYPTEEAIVADYVARGLTYFVLDYVALEKETRFIEPVAYRFASAELYYPLVTSNSFGGKGAIELFVVAPVTLCRPGSNDGMGYFRGDDHDLAVTIPGQPDRKCLDLPVKASTSARLPVEERDLDAIYSGWAELFADTPMFLQAFRYTGDYHFAADILVPVIGEGNALKAEEDGRNPFAPLRDLALPEACHLKPEGGRCKANFEAYYFDPAAGACKWFSYGGCGGVVPFETLDACEKSCLPKN